MPVKGVVCHPITGKIWFAAKGEGAYAEQADGAVRLYVSNRMLSQARLVLSRKDTEGKSLDRWKALGAADISVSGSFGIKTGRIAEADCDGYINESPRAALWDTTPGDCILTEAGGRITTYDNVRLDYDPRHGFFLPRGAVCSNGACHDEFLDKYLRFVHQKKE